jgi:hypothetical protein
LEALEDRRLLAVCNVVRLGDFGAGGTMGEFSRGDLRFCINEANDHPGPDTIRIQVNGTINLTGPLPDLASDMDIVGPGSDLLTIRRDTGGDYRIITVAAGSATIRGMTISNGRADVGGGIFNQGTLTLVDVVVTTNRSTDGHGGGIYNVGTLAMIASFTSDNTAAGTVNPAIGGGIFNSGALTLSGSTISTNVATSDEAAFGAGIYNGDGALLAVNFSTILGNRSEAVTSGFHKYVAGGGIYNAGGGTLSVESSTLHGNAAFVTWGRRGTGFGGGIFSEGPATIVNSTLFGNAVSMPSSPIYGGGIFHSGSPMEIVNSTISNNFLMCGGTPGLFDAWGGGISSAGGILRIGHSTIASNAIQGGGGNLGSKRGAGIAVGGEAVHLHDTVVAMNFFTDAGQKFGPDVFGALASSGYNLIGDPSNSYGYVPTDVLNVDAMLGPLQDNGGPTWTIALLPGSPAIDAGNPNPEDPPEWDQRGPGFPRIVNGRIDIGAFEVQATGMPLSHEFIAFVTADFETAKAKRRR